MNAENNKIINILKMILEEIDRLDLYYADRNKVKTIIYSHMNENKTVEERTRSRECPFDDGEGTCHADKETECPVINCSAKYDIHGNRLK